MTDKTRSEFEEWMRGNGWDDENLYRIGEKYAFREAEIAWQAWLAAKEKYEPRWISVYENLPEEDTDVLCILEDGEMVVASNHNSFFTNAESIDSGHSLLPVTHWTPAPDNPSTQGGGE